MLVINADDFGLTRGVNAGIVHAHRHGVLTSASLFAQAPATLDAITIARATPTLGVGCHLTLVDGRPTLPPDRVPTLVGADGRFRSSWRTFIVDALARRISLAEVERELTAQVVRLHEAGLRLTHLDSHKHVHAWPPIFRVVVGLAGRFSIPVVRVPFEPPPHPLACRSLGGGRRCIETFENLALGPWALADRRAAARAGVRTPTLFGRIETGAFDEGTFRRLTGRLRPGFNELMMHPGFVDADLQRLPTRLRASRQQEVDLLCAPESREHLQRGGVVLATFGAARRLAQPALSSSAVQAGGADS